MVSRLNKNRRIIPNTEYAVGSLVMIKDPSYISNKHNMGKRETKYIGPYTVVRKDRNGNYVVRDTDGNQINRHIPPDQMKHRDDDTNASNTTDNIYEVESIIDHRGEPSHFDYKVKWKGYPMSESTWEPAHNFNDTTCIRDYWAKIDSIAMKD
jgi:Chromo (CHRromatin Organisation MOdifier) domain